MGRPHPTAKDPGRIRRHLTGCSQVTGISPGWFAGMLPWVVNRHGHRSDQPGGCTGGTRCSAYIHPVLCVPFAQGCGAAQRAVRTPQLLRCLRKALERGVRSAIVRGISIALPLPHTPSFPKQALSYPFRSRSRGSWSAGRAAAGARGETRPAPARPSPVLVCRVR